MLLLIVDDPTPPSRRSDDELRKETYDWYHSEIGVGYYQGPWHDNDLASRLLDETFDP